MKGEKLENNVAKSETINEYRVKDNKGVTHTEKVVKNKNTKEVSRSLNGELIKNENNAVAKPTVVQYTPSNGEFVTIKLLEMILNQLKEMNYYLSLQVKDK